MSGSEKAKSELLDQYVTSARQMTNQSQAIRMKQQDLIEAIKDGKIGNEEAAKLCKEYMNNQQKVLDALLALETPQKISGPATTMQVSVKERVTAAEKTLQYLKANELTLYNKVKEHLIRSAGGVASAYRRIEDYY